MARTLLLASGARCFLVLRRAALVGCGAPLIPPAASPDKTKVDAVLKIVRDTMAQRHLNAVIVRVTIDSKEVLTQAAGESMTGVPATPQMHFRNGAPPAK